MKLSEAKEVARRYMDKLQYQELADSPTVRFYTDWSAFERCDVGGQAPTVVLDADMYSLVLSNGEPTRFVMPDGATLRETDDIFSVFKIEESKIMARHVLSVPKAIHVKVGKLSSPLTILADFASESVHVAGHIVLEVGDGAEGAVALVVRSRGTACSSLMVETIVGDNAKLNVLTGTVADSPSSAYVHIRTFVRSGAEINYRSFVTGGAMTRVNEDVTVIGRGSTVDFMGLELGVGNERIDHFVSVVNDAEKGVGRVRLVSVALGESQIVQRALGRITERGQWSDNSVEGIAYTATDKAKVISQPILYVETGEVEGARHSAADASIEDEKKYYIKTRGISEEEIPVIVTRSLIEDFLASVPESVRNIAIPLLLRKVES